MFLNKIGIGLGNVDNTSDLNKPISTLTQNAINNIINNTSAIVANINTSAPYFTGFPIDQPVWTSIGGTYANVVDITYGVLNQQLNLTSTNGLSLTIPNQYSYQPCTLKVSVRLAFKSNADCVNVDIGLFKSLALSTLFNPTPVLLRLVKFTFKFSAV